MTPLETRYTEPFDRTYAHVTRGIVEFANAIPAPGSRWLRQLVQSFALERTLWDQRPELVFYCLRWRQFNNRLLWLIAGAYLHVSYDLPRAMASDWPGRGIWQHGPSRDLGESIFFRLSDTFPAALRRSATDYRTVGLFAFLFRTTSQKVLAVGEFWLETQRQGAWLIAEHLSSSQNRAYAEDMMARALTMALGDAALWRPWSFAFLRPPTNVLRSPSLASWLAVLLTIAAEGVRYVGLIAATVFLSDRISYGREQVDALRAFVDAWGYLTHDYVSYAARNPDTFYQYREKRLSELGILYPGRSARSTD